MKDCEKYDILYKLILQRNSGQGYHGYHRYVVGREACAFFKGKHKRIMHKPSIPCTNDTTIANFFSQPFIYVYNSADTSFVYKGLVDSIREEYEVYFYSRLPLEADSLIRMPLIPDTRVTMKMLTEKNVFLIGDSFECFLVREFCSEVKRELASKGGKAISLGITINPYNRKRRTLFYDSKDKKRFRHLVNFPWMIGNRRTMLIELDT